MHAAKVFGSTKVCMAVLAIYLAIKLMSFYLLYIANKTMHFNYDYGHATWVAKI